MKGPHYGLIRFKAILTARCPAALRPCRCRPLGDGGVFTVSRAHKSLVLELQPEGVPGSWATKAEALSPLAVVQQQLSRLPPEQR